VPTRFDDTNRADAHEWLRSLHVPTLRFFPESSVQPERYHQSTQRFGEINLCSNNRQLRCANLYGFVGQWRRPVFCAHDCAVSVRSSDGLRRKHKVVERFTHVDLVVLRSEVRAWTKTGSNSEHSSTRRLTAKINSIVVPTGTNPRFRPTASECDRALAPTKC